MPREPSGGPSPRPSSCIEHCRRPLVPESRLCPQWVQDTITGAIRQVLCRNRPAMPLETTQFMNPLEDFAACNCLLASSKVVAPCTSRDDPVIETLRSLR